jgi:protein-S-isoprenylcysteine O-methyltransferase Ste14
VTRQLLVLVSNFFMVLVLLVLSLVALFTEEPTTRPLPIRITGGAGLVSLVVHVLARLWPTRKTLAHKLQEWRVRRWSK